MKILATLMVLMFLGAHLHAQQWEQTGGPEGGDVLSLAANDAATLALLRPGVIYRYEAGGWKRASSLAALSIYASGNAFIALNHEGVFRSADRGDHWEKVGPAGFLFRAATYRDDLYIAADSIIYRLSDDAATWTRVASSGRLDFFSFAVLDSTVLIGRGGDSVGVFRSSDSGRTWSRTGAGLPPGNAPQLFHRAGDVLYGVFNTFGIFRSADGGATWSADNEGLPKNGVEYPWVQSILTAGGRLWIAGRSGAFSRADSAWRAETVIPQSALATGGGRMYMGSAGGVMSSADSGRSWMLLNTGLRAHRITGLATFGTAVLAGAGGYIHRSTDGGNHWTRTAMIDADRFAHGRDAMYVLGDGFPGRGIFRTVDGLDWGPVGENLPFDPQWLSALAVSGDTVVAGYYRVGWNMEAQWRHGGVYRSVDGGQTWRPSSSGLPMQGTADVPVLELFAARGVLLAHTVRGLYRSGNGGDSWTRVQFDTLPGITSLVFAASGGKIYAARGGKVHISEDAGVTWANISNGIPPEAFAHHLSIVRGIPYLSVTLDRSVGRVYTLRSGVWEEITAQLPDEAFFWEFMESQGRVIGSTAWSSIWRRDLGPVAGLPDESGSRDLKLAASPNPFIAGSGVDLEIREGGTVRLVLLSPLGAEIATLYDGKMEAGRHRLRLDGTGLPSGVYHLRLQQEGASVTMTVVKVR